MSADACHYTLPEPSGDGAFKNGITSTQDEELKKR